MLPSAKRHGLFPALSLLLPPQNGVVHGEAAVALDPSHGNNVSHGHSPYPPRPRDLGVKHEGLRELADSDGSLPCSPDSQSDSELEAEALESDTRQLLHHFLQLHTGLCPARRSPQSPALSTMTRVVDNLLDKHRYAYNGMVNKLSVDDRGDDVTFVSAVAKSLFEDGTTNWGRVASLIAFGAVVCQLLKSRGREQCVEKVAHEISTYLLDDQRDWLLRNNAWEGFVDFFREHDPESKVRNTLMAVAGLAGIGATLAMLIR